MMRRKGVQLTLSRRIQSRPARRLPKWALLLAMLITTIPAATPVRATFPGGNGRIFYSREITAGDDFTAEIFSIKPNGEGIRD